jgi:hypothetical protein
MQCAEYGPKCETDGSPNQSGLTGVMSVVDLIE